MCTSINECTTYNIQQKTVAFLSAINRKHDNKKTIASLMSLNFQFDIQIRGSEFGVNSMNAFIHLFIK